MNVISHQFSHAGRKSENEDAALSQGTVNIGWWAAIADGMGGHAGGRKASETAINVVRSTIESNSAPSIPEIFACAQSELRFVSTESPELTKMGTTLSVLQIYGGQAKIGHVGDTRIYHLRNDGIISRTVDQTEVQELITRGVLSKANARRYPRRNILLSVLSPSSEYQLFETNFEVQRGDRFVLMTDGVSSKVPARELRDLSIKSNDLSDFCDELRNEVRLRKPTDDYSAICLEIRA